MTKAKLGDWRWYCGASRDDDEMSDCGTRDAALAEGRTIYAGDPFYIVEARMRATDENAMASGRRDTAPFAETRNGKWVGKA